MAEDADLDVLVLESDVNAVTVRDGTLPRQVYCTVYKRIIAYDSPSIAMKCM